MNSNRSCLALQVGEREHPQMLKDTYFTYFPLLRSNPVFTGNSFCSTVLVLGGCRASQPGCSQELHLSCVHNSLSRGSLFLCYWSLQTLQDPSPTFLQIPTPILKDSLRNKTSCLATGRAERPDCMTPQIRPATKKAWIELTLCELKQNICMPSCDKG